MNISTFLFAFSGVLRRVRTYKRKQKKKTKLGTAGQVVVREAAEARPEVAGHLHRPPAGGAARWLPLSRPESLSSSKLANSKLGFLEILA